VIATKLPQEEMVPILDRMKKDYAAFKRRQQEEAIPF